MTNNLESRRSFRISEPTYLKYEVLTDREFADGLERRKIRLGIDNGAQSELIDVEARLSQAMYQMGGLHWQQFFPRTVATLVANQNGDGSWDSEDNRDENEYGRAYTTALVVLALSAPNQVLPIYQR